MFEESQHPIIVGQAAYNSAYGTGFAASSWCNSTSGGNVCDGFARISDQGGDLFGFNTLLTGNTAKLNIPLQPKATHDEMNSAAFDEFGRMTANMGLEAVPATPAAQNIVLYPYINPQTELIDGTNLPAANLDVTPIARADDRDSDLEDHPQRRGYPSDPLSPVRRAVAQPGDVGQHHHPAGSLGGSGWKDTVRVSPASDTIVALRPVIPQVPWEVPNSIRTLNPAMPIGSNFGFNNADAGGNPTAPITNQLVNFGWEYVWHCHILSHEEMDMMRPVSLALPPKPPINPVLSKSGSTVTVAFSDNSLTETSFHLQRTADSTTWTDVGTPIARALDSANTKGDPLALTNSGVSGNPGPVYGYRVAAVNTVGYGGEFPSLSVQSVSAPVVYSGNATLPAAPTNLTASLATGPRVNLTWVDNATNENGFVIQRSSNGVTFIQIGTAPARTNTGSVTFPDPTVVLGNTYTYRVAAVNGKGLSAFVTSAPVSRGHPGSSDQRDRGQRCTRRTKDGGSDLDRSGGRDQLQRSLVNSLTMTPATQANNVLSGTQINVGGTAGTSVYMQVRANNVLGSSAWTPTTPVTVTRN